MGFVGILLSIVLALFVIMIQFVMNGIRDKNWKKAVFSIIIFIGIVLIMYFGLIEFITSM